MSGTCSEKFCATLTASCPVSEIDDQQRLVRLRDVRDGLHLVHQRLIDVQPAGGIEHDDVEALQLRRLQRTPGDVDRLLPGHDRQRRDLDLGAQHRKLFLRRRAIDVERRHHHLLALALAQQPGELRGGRGLARTLEPDQHDDRGRRDGDVELGGVRPEHVDQRVMDDLDDLLPRRDRTEHVLADGDLGRLFDELTRDRQRHIGFEQRHADFAHRGTDIGFGQRAATAQAIEHPSQPVTQTFEHAGHSTRGTAHEPLKQNTPADETSSAGVAHGRQC